MHGGEVAELMDQVLWKVLPETQQKSEDRRRLGVCEAMESDEHFIGADGVHAARSIQYTLPQYRWNSQKVENLFGSPWAMVH